MLPELGTEIKVTDMTVDRVLKGEKKKPKVKGGSKEGRGEEKSEDLILLPTLLALIHGSAERGGSFAELGAFDGVSYSNTFMLEKCFGWRGVLIEANPVRSGAHQSSTPTARRPIPRPCRTCRTTMQRRLRAAARAL